MTHADYMRAKSQAVAHLVLSGGAESWQEKAGGLAKLGSAGMSININDGNTK